MHRLYTILLMSLVTIVAMAQTPIDKADLSIPSRIAPAFFGPNAFPVPDMLDGRTSSDLKLELYADGFFGTMNDAVSVRADDFTADLFARITVPLFTKRVNLTLWMPVMEYYSMGPEINAYRRVQHDGYLEGSHPGDVYISTDIMLLTQEKNQIDATVRAALKSASGHGYHHARNYDSPGYFFDASFGRSFGFSEVTTFRTALSGGFLCWQTDNGRQNDAVMYGILAALYSRRFSFEAEYGGYVGWERLGDAPMTLKTSAAVDIGNFAIRLQYRIGFIDYPFHQVRVGLEYRLPLDI